MADKHHTGAMPLSSSITFDKPSTHSPQFSLPPPSFATSALHSQHKENTLAPITSPMVMESKKPFDINSLMSPPEPTPFDNFSPQRSSPMHTSVSKPQAPMSPPVSPFSKAADSVVVQAPPTPNSVVSVGLKDPILYPGQDATPSPPQRPLFASADLIEHRRLVDEHVASRSSSLFRAASPPNREDYELALYFKSQVMRNYMSDPKRWLRKERELLVADRRAGAKRNTTKLAPLLPARLPTGSLHGTYIKPRAPRPDKVGKPYAPRPIRTNPGPPRQTARISATPEPRRVVAPNREDKDFTALSDYCPPLSSLPSKPNSLKVDWKGAPIDLSGDPNARLLHADEVSLAANLRLDCATYLTSKRRIFIRRLECAKVGKEFRKTDAQQACKIDVNKASKLWTAFEKVGWLELGWMRKYL